MQALAPTCHCGGALMQWDARALAQNGTGVDVGASALQGADAMGCVGVGVSTDTSAWRDADTMGHMRAPVQDGTVRVWAWNSAASHGRVGAGVDAMGRARALARDDETQARGRGRVSAWRGIDATGCTGRMAECGCIGMEW